MLHQLTFGVFVIHPLITHSIKNKGIRKVKNDKLDSVAIANIGLKPDLKTFLMPSELVLELRSLTCNYYDFMDERASHVTALKTALHTVFPQYLDIFSDILGNTSKMILRQYQIELLDTIPDVGLLTAVSILCELGDFSAFHSPKQLFAYFGMDPTVNESGKFKATEVHMSKRGSRIARRAIFAVALACIRTKRNGEALNPYLYEYYNKKKESKPKMVALGAIMHKVCNIIFAVLRNNSVFEFRSTEEHRNSYRHPEPMAA